MHCKPECSLKLPTQPHLPPFHRQIHDPVHDPLVLKLCGSLLGFYKDHPCVIQVPASGRQRTAADKAAGLRFVVACVTEYFQAILDLPALPALPKRAFLRLDLPGVQLARTPHAAREPVPKSGAAPRPSSLPLKYVRAQRRKAK